MKISTRPRRGAALLAALLGTTLLLTACGSDGSNDESKGTEGNTAESEGFPVTVDSTHGEITVEKKPERILVIGGDYVDLLTSIDEQPVAFAGYGDTDEKMLLANYPWLTDLYTGEFDPKLTTAEYKADAEAIAVHEPDLIIGSPYYIEEKQYAQLSAIAPTYVTPTSADRSWTDTLTDLAALTGKSEEAAAAIAGVDDAFADARDKLTGLQGKTLSIAENYEGRLSLISAAKWIEDLGLRPAANQPEPGTPFVELSQENLDELTGDIAFLITYDEASQAAFEDDPRIKALPAVENDSLFFIKRAQVDAGLGAGPSSLEWLIEQFVPVLEQSPLNASS